MRQTTLYIIAALLVTTFFSCKNNHNEDAPEQVINEKSPATYRLPFEPNSEGAEVIDYNYTENDSTPRTILIHALDSAGMPTPEVIGMLALHSNQKTYMGGGLKNNERDGLWQSFYENGQVWSETTYKDGVEEGFSRTFYENGQIRYEGNYKSGKMDGKWNYYDETGKLIKTETYKEGQLMQ